MDRGYFIKFTAQAELKYTNNQNYGVVSTLIYGAQWDAAIKFIETYNVGEEGYSTYATNSAGYGNYSGTYGGDTSTATPDICGALPIFRQKNIYDMAGNVHEWTMEKYSSYRVYRGGSYDDSGDVYSAAARASGNLASYPSVGFRNALYIKN